MHIGLILVIFSFVGFGVDFIYFFENFLNDFKIINMYIKFSLNLKENKRKLFIFYFKSIVIFF